MQEHILKSSVYNYFIEDIDRTIIFNGLTECFFEVKTDHVPYYKEIIKNPESFKDEFSRFISNLINGGFVIDSNLDEKNLVRNKFNNLIKNNEYYLLILPTYQCNVDCWYCVQDHKDMWMSDETFERIKKRVILKLKEEEINHLHISWFGGEPLLANDKIIKYNKIFKKLAEDSNKYFSSAITTNGILLNINRIKELKDSGVINYQITIDGTQNFHDNIKHLKDGSAFAKTLNNINEIASHTPCILRFNYTHKNLNPEGIIKDVTKFIEIQNRKNVYLRLHKVWQEDAVKIDNQKVENLFNLGLDAGFNSSYPQCGICYADQKHYECILPNGKVEKCDNINPDQAEGELLADGSISWEKDTSPYHTPIYMLETAECHSCKYFPFCQGACVMRRQNMINTNGKIVCFRRDKDSEMAEEIKKFVKTKKVEYSTNNQ